jgi:hypothetical protein
VKSDDNAKIIKKRENQKVTRGKYCPWMFMRRFT